MNILLCGANGFIGRHLEQALSAAGHRVVRGVRTPRSCSDISVDYGRDTAPEVWLARLENVDAVINAVGILNEEGASTFNALHRDAPIALFKACVEAGVDHVVQISALGGNDDDALTPYMRSKREADAHLMTLPLNWLIIRPSLIVGADGESSKVFRTLASLPVIGLPGKGDQQLQPVHIDDVCAAVVHALASSSRMRRVVNAVGPEPMSYRDMLMHYRKAMGVNEPIWLPIPMATMRMAARIGDRIPQRLLSADTLLMLEQGNTADPEPFRQLVGKALKGPRAWFAAMPPGMLRADAIWRWVRPLFQLVLAIVWIVTGLLSLGIYPVEESYALLTQVGLEGTLASIALYGAALLDIGLGIATLAWPGRWLWRMQIILMAGYTIIISLFLPEFWLHPFGPILKNLPILALLIALDATEGK
jgi:uncharacterized protein YbjT (DUF2867 family)